MTPPQRTQYIPEADSLLISENELQDCASDVFVCVWGAGGGGSICLSTVRASSQGTRTPPLQDKHILPVSADEVRATAAQGGGSRSQSRTRRDGGCMIPEVNGMELTGLKIYVPEKKVALGHILSAVSTMPSTNTTHFCSCEFHHSLFCAFLHSAKILIPSLT